MTPHQCWNVCGWKTTEKDQPNEAQLSLFPRAHIESEEKPSFRLWPSRFRKVARPPNYTHKQRDTRTKRRNTLIPKKAHDVQTVTKKSRKPDKLTQNQRETQGASRQLTLRSSFKNSTPLFHPYSLQNVAEELESPRVATSQSHSEPSFAGRATQIHESNCPSLSTVR